MIPEIYSSEQTCRIVECLEQFEDDQVTSASIHAVRCVLDRVEGLKELLLTPALIEVLKEVLSPDYFIAKSIYFDKPEGSNWFVAMHQDLTISVDQKMDIAGFGPWTSKDKYYSVQPPLNVLQSNYTLRIHLDDTNEDNGALRVIPQSHQLGIVRKDAFPNLEDEVVCQVQAGGAMWMKPLLLHRSTRSITGKRRRVIHIEFAKDQLPRGLNWFEKQDI